MTALPFTSCLCISNLFVHNKYDGHFKSMMQCLLEANILHLNVDRNDGNMIWTMRWTCGLWEKKGCGKL